MTFVLRILGSKTFSAKQFGNLIFYWLHTNDNLLNDVYHILSSIVRNFFIENNVEIFPAHYTWKVAEKGFMMAFMMNKLAIINSCKIILEK